MRASEILNKVQDKLGGSGHDDHASAEDSDTRVLRYTSPHGGRSVLKVVGNSFGWFMVQGQFSCVTT